MMNKCSEEKLCVNFDGLRQDLSGTLLKIVDTYYAFYASTKTFH